MHPRIHTFFGKHHGGRGLGRFGGRFSGHDHPGGPGFNMGRKLAAADLQLLVLALLAEKPRHGYEIIKALEERSHGFYVPSPGMVYPALTYIEELGHATVTPSANRKLYHITPEGTAYLKERQAQLDSLLTQMELVGRKMQRMRRSFDAQVGSDAQTGNDMQIEGSLELRQAIDALRAILREKMGDSVEEQNRIAAILQRACADIASQ